MKQKLTFAFAFLLTFVTLPGLAVAQDMSGENSGEEGMGASDQSMEEQTPETERRRPRRAEREQENAQDPLEGLNLPANLTERQRQQVTAIVRALRAQGLNNDQIMERLTQMYAQAQRNRNNNNQPTTGAGSRTETRATPRPNFTQAEADERISNLRARLEQEGLPEERIVEIVDRMRVRMSESGQMTNADGRYSPEQQLQRLRYQQEQRRTSMERAGASEEEIEAAMEAANAEVEQQIRNYYQRAVQLRRMELAAQGATQEEIDAALAELQEQFRSYTERVIPREENSGSDSMEGSMEMESQSQEGMRRRNNQNSEDTEAIDSMKLPVEPESSWSRESVKDVVESIDGLFSSAWREADIRKADECSDAEFIRRLSLDLNGQIPEAVEAYRFVTSSARTKREELIDQYLANERYSVHWSKVFRDYLSGQTGVEAARFNRQLFQDYLRECFAENRAWNQMTIEMVSGEGSTAEWGALNYLARMDFSPSDVAGKTARDFLGIQIQCAQCHEGRGPSYGWEQADFQQYAAFFARMVRDPITNNRGNRVADFVMEARPALVDTRSMNSLTQQARRTPENETILLGAPRILGQTEEWAESDEYASRRRELAIWMTAPENPYYAKSIVNRMWAEFFGAGFVMPVDGFGGNEKPVVEAAMNLLAEDFTAHGFDLRRLFRIIVSTKVYQLAGGGTSEETSLFSKSVLRPMSAEQFFDTTLQATGIMRLEDRNLRRTLERQAANIYREFIFTFNDDELGESADEGGSIPQALLMLNGVLTNEGIRNRPGSTLDFIMTSFENVSDQVDYLFLATLTRMPNRTEKRAFLEHIAETRDKEDALEDAFWALLNSSEFQTIH
ncbi:MAG: DUF1549 and DUF1553 domain-containing protein [Planctomycetes bacterium]|nr:DUF1549 and DUF1553 domain-containing protein [Planctomycetota bacterium]